MENRFYYSHYSGLRRMPATAERSESAFHSKFKKTKAKEAERDEIGIVCHVERQRNISRTTNGEIAFCIWNLYRERLTSFLRCTQDDSIPNPHRQKYQHWKLKIACLLFLCFSSLQSELINAAPVKVTTKKQLSVVRVNVTNQAFDFFRPWSKKAPYSRHALGTVLSKNRILVTAELVENSNYIELEKAESGEKVAATLETVDYESNLALLKSTDEDFLKDIKPLELTNARVGDRLTVWQLESNGALLSTDALMTTVEVAGYPIDETALLTYRLTSSLQYRESSFTLPVIKENQLAGILMRYDTRTQNVDVIPAPVIEHFLKASEQKKYHGFPGAGILFAATRDPQLRRYAGLDGKYEGGVYITKVQKFSPANKAGLKVGDLLLGIADEDIDQDGNYSDPLYGKISIVHLISTKSYDGDVVKFKIFRNGNVQQVDVTLQHRPAENYVVEPYTITKAPKYYILGGLVLQELSRQYLKEWGKDWLKKAPERFVYFDRYQSELFPDTQKKLVILSQVLPSSSTIGYEQLDYLLITKINGIAINSLADVAVAIEKPIDGFHKIEFDGEPTEIYFDAKQVATDDAALIKTYGLPALKRLE